MQIPTRPVVIDVRNNYETRIGIFKGAVDPCTTAFYEFPSWVENQFQPDGAEVEHEKVEKIGLNERNNKDAEIPTRPVVIDVRNYYETRIGMFKGAADPCTTAFR